jgi:hypothetical protein
LCVCVCTPSRLFKLVFSFVSPLAPFFSFYYYYYSVLSVDVLDVRTRIEFFSLSCSLFSAPLLLTSGSAANTHAPLYMHFRLENTILFSGLLASLDFLFSFTVSLCFSLLSFVHRSFYSVFLFSAPLFLSHYFSF